jgi:cation transport ATPase
LALVAIATHIVLRFSGAPKLAMDAPLLLALAAGGVPLLVTLIGQVARGQLNADLLAGISIVTAVIVGEYLAGATIVLMLSGGVALENYAMRRASAVLDALARRAPSVAHKQIGGGLLDVPLSEIAVATRW